MSPTLNITQAAELLQIHPHSLEKMIRNGEIAAGKIGRAYVLMTKDVLSYVEQIIVHQTAQRMRRSPGKNKV